ncbi:hypothetical protein AVEN_139199-1 [Araneus ventricosus]|uniref:Uncharacterized protein n=1 Tax=Araneus ventricosus TaxID=182803 RepID=A0A4Y2TR84_ARAVE|nr:hypothetical protein AVEN_192508-1 [Araneus ventricosus]GBO03146.1 hypothetical protein AVEN_139199-1 [Araneus ventricosus]
MILRATGPTQDGSSVELGFEPVTLLPQSRDLTTRHRDLQRDKERFEPLFQCCSVQSPLSKKDFRVASDIGRRDSPRELSVVVIAADRQQSAFVGCHITRNNERRRLRGRCHNRRDSIFHKMRWNASSRI